MSMGWSTAGRSRLFVAIGTFSLAGALLLSSKSALASSVSVTTFDDVVVDDNQCSLREAIHAIQVDFDYNGCQRIPGSNEIFLQPTPVQTYALQSPIVISGTTNVNIKGAGFDHTAVSGGGSVSSAFVIGDGSVIGSSATLSNLQIREFEGSAIVVGDDAVATITHVKVTDGGDTFTNAACLFNAGFTVFLQSECSNLVGRNPGLVINTGRLFIGNSSFVDSWGEVNMLANFGDLEIYNSTVGNNTPAYGLIVTDGGQTHIEASTIAFNAGRNNSCTECGALLTSGTGTMTLKSSIVANNTNNGVHYNCGTSMSMTSQGYNVFGSTDGTCDEYLTADDTVEEPWLQEDGNSPQVLGSLSRVYVPEDFSGVVGFVPGAHCVAADQRGVTRRGAANCDAGAVERSSALFVRDLNLPLTAGDALINERLDALGFEVTALDDNNASAGAAAGHALVVISNSVSSAAVGTTFKTVPQGVLAMEPWLFDDMGWSLEPGGYTEATTDIFLVGTRAGGIASNFGVMSGPIAVTTSAQQHGYGFTDTGKAEVDAAAPPGWGIFSFTPLRALPDGSQAAGHRVASFAGDAASANLTEAGVRLVDLTILHAARLNNFTTVPLFSTFEAEALMLWTPTQGSLNENTVQMTEGAASMSVNASGYTRLDSVSFSTSEWQGASDELLLDVYVPPQGQPNPYYLGAVQMYLSAPTANIYNQYLGQVELTPGGTGWRTVSFVSDLMALFAADLEDASFGIAVNTEPGAPPVLLDNLRFAGSVPAPPPTSVFDFEDGTSGFNHLYGGASSVEVSTTQAFDGVQSLAVNVDGSSDVQVWVVPTTSPAPGSTVSLRIFVPNGAPLLAASPYMMDQNWTWTDTWNQSLPQGQWVTLSVTVPSNAVLPLNQLGFKLYLNGSYQGPIYVDAVDW